MSRHQRRVYILLGWTLLFGSCVALSNAIEHRIGDVFALLAVLFILVLQGRFWDWVEP